MKVLKVCKKCGRVLEGKRWRPPKKGEIERARLMDRIEYTICEDCRKHSRYHNSVLQIRGKYAVEIFEKALNIALGKKLEFFVEGQDIFFRDKKAALKVAKALQKITGIKPVVTEKIVDYDRQRSRSLTRQFVSLRADFLRGEKVEYLGHIYTVVESGKEGVKIKGKRGTLTVKPAKLSQVRIKKAYVLDEFSGLVFIPEEGEKILNEVEKKKLKGKEEVEVAVAEKDVEVL